MIVVMAGEPSVNEFLPCFLFIAKKVHQPLPLFLDICECVAVVDTKTTQDLSTGKLSASVSNYVRLVSHARRELSKANLVYADLITAYLIKMRTRLTGGVAYFDRVLELADTRTVLRKNTLSLIRQSREAK